MMTNPIPHIGLFATPDSMESFQDQLDSFTNPQERQIAYLAGMLALNLAHKLVAEMLQSEKTA